MGSRQARHEAGREGGGCHQTRVQALESIIDLPGAPLPETAAKHIGSCPACREEIDALVWVDAALSGSLGRARASIPRPSTEDIDAILSAARLPPPEAVWLGTTRRTVNRMLLLTLLVLSLLGLCGVGWLLLLAWKATHGG